MGLIEDLNSPSRQVAHQLREIARKIEGGEVSAMSMYWIDRDLNVQEIRYEQEPARKRSRKSAV